MTRKTKEQLLADIAAIEQQFAAEIRAHEDTRAQRDETLRLLAAARAELNALYVAQRPSRDGGVRATLAPVVTETIVTMRGVQYRKVRAWEHGRYITTYKPLAVQ